ERILVGAGVNAMGSGFELVRPVGGLVERLDHQWNYARGIPDPRYPGADRALNLNAYAVIWVNERGERFVNESAGAAAILKAMLAQPRGRAWIVFDAEGRKSVSPSGTDWRDPAKVERMLLENPAIGQKAATLEDLAAKAGFPRENFLAAIRRFNEAIATSQDREFARFSKQNPPVALPGRPALLAIEKPPFYAVPMYPMTRKSMGGIAVDLEGRVLDAKRQPIAGLYAAGEATGFAGLNGKAGLEGTFIGPSILQGRRLGGALAKLATPGAEIAPKAVAPGAVVEAPCQSCHDVAKLVTSPRKGYWHFERSHRTVLERQWACVNCHVEMQPFRAGAHRIDRVKQIDACARCHLGSE
ncbi:MAG: FAD-binding protein, partial [Bryobacteraceae bacterium]|nr:FAD-binding protein [Bryobacteraceae bacterium]